MQRAAIRWWENCLMATLVAALALVYWTLKGCERLQGRLRRTSATLEQRR